MTFNSSLSNIIRQGMDHAQSRGVTIIVDWKTFSFQLTEIFTRVTENKISMTYKVVLVKQFSHISFNDIALNEYKFRSSIGLGMYGKIS